MAARLKLAAEALRARGCGGAVAKNYDSLVLGRERWATNDPDADALVCA